MLYMRVAHDVIRLYAQDMIKVRIQLNASIAGATTSPFAIATKMVAAEGFGSLYAGLSAGLTRQARFPTPVPLSPPACSSWCSSDCSHVGTLRSHPVGPCQHITVNAPAQQNSNIGLTQYDLAC